MGKTFFSRSLATIVVIAAGVLPLQAGASPINGTATLNDVGVVLNNGSDLSNTSSISVANFSVVAETGNITVPVSTTEPGTTFDLTNLSSLSFSGPIDFTASSGTIEPGRSADFLNLLYTGTASAEGLSDTAGTLTVTFTDNSGTLGGSNVVAAFTPVPEPASLLLLGTGLLGLGLTKRASVRRGLRFLSGVRQSSV